MNGAWYRYSTTYISSENNILPSSHPHGNSFAIHLRATGYNVWNGWR